MLAGVAPLIFRPTACTAQQSPFLSRLPTPGLCLDGSTVCALEWMNVDRQSSSKSVLMSIDCWPGLHRSCLTAARHGVLFSCISQSCH